MKSDQFKPHREATIGGHQNNARQAANQCRHILGEQLREDDFRVVLLFGNGREHRQVEDVTLVRNALEEVGWKPE